MVNSLKKKSYQDNQVAIRNSVVRSSHNLTLAEKRLISTAVGLRHTANKNGYIDIDVSEYAQTFDLSIKNAYKQCKEAVQGIRNKWILFSEKHPADKRKHKGGGFAWCIAYHYNDGEGTVTIALNPLLMPYIQGLEENFTTYNLSSVTGFKSAYTWRLYELLKQFSNTGVCIITVDDFRHAMECSDYYLKDFNRLKTRIIMPSIKELERKTGVLIDLETQRKGRKITTLQFNFKKNPQSEFEF